MTPKQSYQLDVKNEAVVYDQSQAEAVDALELIYHDLVQSWAKPKGLLGVFKRFVVAPPQAVKGLYLWGGVGRGKTFLMDLFYRSLPSERKLRLHFHRFMQMVHARLNEHQGEKNPLKLVAEDIVKGADVICFDEFFVTEIGDAMILANLLDVILRSGVTLVATSNISPDLLYENGLQREKFIPAIKLIQEQTLVMKMLDGVDYRLRTLEQAKVFHFPLSESAELALETCFQDLVVGLEYEEDCVLDILGREVQAKCCAGGVVWFDFCELCEGNRSAADYIEVARLFHTVLLSNVPILGASSDASARRFISLIDEFYDHNVKLIISAEEGLQKLYQGQELLFPFERTQSRLLEMQSHEYLAREHNS